MRSITFITLVVLSFAVNAIAQTHFNIGVRDSFYSQILGEQRELLIYLPDQYDQHKKYPVAYLLDAEAHFHMFTGIVNHLGNYAIPEMMVIGIVNVNRNKDFPPTRDTSTYDPANGEGEKFTRFLKEELIPYINTHYSVAPYRLLAGHSLGGLFVVNTLLNHHNLFNAYISIDPALCWDQMRLSQQSAGILATNNLNSTRLFLGLSGKVPISESGIMNVLKDTSSKELNIRSVLYFRQQLQYKAFHAPIWKSKDYPNEAHGSVPLLAYYDGLCFAFDFYKRPSLSVLTDTTVKMLTKHYQKIYEKMGYEILPPEYDLAGLAWRSAVLEKNYERALLFLKDYLILYPKSPKAYESIGDYYDVLGNPDKAKVFYDKAKDLVR